MPNNTFSGERHNGREFMVGAMCGAAVGAVVGLLIATKPGTELRQQVADSARRFGRQVGDTYDQAAHAFSSAIDRGQEALRRGRDTFDEVRQHHAGEEFPSTPTSERIS